MIDAILKKTSKMVGTIKTLTANCSILGEPIRKEINRVLLTYKNSWVKFGFSFIDLNDGSKKLMLANFKSTDNIYKRYNYYIISNREEAFRIRDFIDATFSEK